MTRTHETHLRFLPCMLSLNLLSSHFSCRDGEEEALTAEERFRRAREAMRARDATDRAAQKAARRSKKLDRKERLRAQAAGESDDDAGVQLGATSLGASMSEGETTHSFIRS